jgi:hypothetical protein
MHPEQNKGRNAHPVMPSVVVVANAIAEANAVVVNEMRMATKPQRLKIQSPAMKLAQTVALKVVTNVVQTAIVGRMKMSVMRQMQTTPLTVQQKRLAD